MDSYKSFYRKLCLNWNHYKATHHNKSYLLFTYIFCVLFYRYFARYFFAFPLFIIYFILYPFIKLRFIKLIGSAIGHYSVTTELFLKKIEEVKDDKFINVFYIENSPFEPSISNYYLHEMWKRSIIILPLSCSAIINALDKFIMLFLSKKAYNLYGIKSRYEYRWVRDPDGILCDKPPHLKFTKEEHRFAQEILKKINVDTSSRYICLFIRSDAYNKGHPTWHYPERNADISTYMKACHFLANKGYYVFRMGKIVDKSFPSMHPKIIDYARSSIRSDFMDIYLSANCYFFITTGAGLDGIPQIFRRPILYTNCFVLPHVHTWYPHYLFICKNWYNKKSKRLLSFKEQIYFFHSHPDYIKRRTFHISDYIEKYELEPIANTEDELLEAIQEMEARMTENWKETDEEKLLQREFWEMFITNIKLTDDEDTHKPLHKKIFVKIGSNFLSRYQYLLESQS